MCFTKKIIGAALYLSCGLMSPVYAANLLQLFHQALSADPTLQKQSFISLSEQQDVPINRANLLPNLDARSQYGRQYQQNLTANNSSVSLNLSQPIFNDVNAALIEQV